LKEFLLAHTGHSLYPTTLAGKEEEFAEFSFLGGKRKGGGLARNPVVSELHKAREELRSANQERKAAEMLTLKALLGDKQRRLVAEAAEVFGQTQKSLMQSLANQIKSTAGFATASLDKKLAIVASRLAQLEEEVRRRRQEGGSTSGGAGQPTLVPGIPDR
jgi:hypothetical protein